jgi:hypothetical protein
VLLLGDFMIETQKYNPMLEKREIVVAGTTSSLGIARKLTHLLSSVGNTEFGVRHVPTAGLSTVDFPWAAIVTDIGTKEPIQDYERLLGRVSPLGFICFGAEDKNIKQISREYPGYVVDYGLLDGQFRAGDIAPLKRGVTFTLLEDGKKRGRVDILGSSDDDILCALALISAALQLGVKLKQIQKFLTESEFESDNFL